MQYRDGVLYVDQVPVARIADRFGTPCYVYSATRMRAAVAAYQQAFAGLSFRVCYAVKANGNTHIIRLFRDAGCGADVVSGGELALALRAGVAPSHVVFAGVGKTPAEMAAALRAGIGVFVVESPAELDDLTRIAARMHRRARVALRLNPDVDPGTHRYVATGLGATKFDLPPDQIVDVLARARDRQSLEVIGIHQHIGSQIQDPEPFVRALQVLRAVMEEVRSYGVTLRWVDLGGGPGVAASGETVPAPAQLARVVRQVFPRPDFELWLEPGRSLVGAAGILVTRVVRVKETRAGRFVVTDAGMNDLIRPALYGARHPIRPVTEPDRPVSPAHVVGPLCESGDFLGHDVDLPAVRHGEYLAVFHAGAYGYAMASNYNGRPRPAEVLVDGARCALIRRRETVADLWRREVADLAWTELI